MQNDSITPVLRKRVTYGETYCGADRATYKWCQTISDLDIIVPVPPEVLTTADIDVKTTPETVHIKFKKPDESLWTSVIDGEYSYKTKSSEMMWSLERGKHISIHIEKVKERWWDSLLKDEPKINLKELELTRPMSDLSEEEEMTLQKIWSKQLEKKNGPESSH